MLISIIVPCFNAERTLRQTLDSIYNQTYTNWEAICVNDGSHDNTEQILNKYAQLDNRFLYFTQRNLGVSAARNLALKHCKGKYICFIDSDDIVDTSYLQHLIEMALDYPASDLWMCDFTRDINCIANNKTFKINTITRNQFIHQTIYNSKFNPQLWCMLFKKHTIDNYKIHFTEGCTRGEDREFYMKYILHTQEITFSDAKLYYYRLNNQSAMSTMNETSLTSLGAAERTLQYYIINAQTELVPVMQTHIDYTLWKLNITACIKNNKQVFKILQEKYQPKLAMRRLYSYPRLSVKLSAILYNISHSLFYTITHVIGKHKYNDQHN